MHACSCVLRPASCGVMVACPGLYLHSYAVQCNDAICPPPPFFFSRGAPKNVSKMRCRKFVETVDSSSSNDILTW